MTQLGDPTLARMRQSAVGLLLAGAIVACWAGIHAYAMFAFELSLATLPLALGIVAVQCWLSVGLFIVSHDAMHGSLAPGGGRLNAVIGGALLFLYAGFGWRRMRAAHFAHHLAPGSIGDPDFSVAHSRRFWPWYGTFLARYFGWPSLLFVGTVVTVYWTLAGVPVDKIVLLYGVPAILSSMQLFYFGTFRPHCHTGADFADAHRARSETFGPVASLVTCFHFGYHHEHHRAPHLPWWRLPAARRAASTNGTAS